MHGCYNGGTFIHSSSHVNIKKKYWMYATNQRKGKSLHHVHIYREKDTKSTLQEVNTIQLFTLVLWTQVASKIVLELCFVDYFYVYALWYLLFFNHHRHKVVCMWVCVSNFDVNLFVQVINFFLLEGICQWKVYGESHFCYELICIVGANFLRRKCVF